MASNGGLRAVHLPRLRPAASHPAPAGVLEEARAYPREPGLRRLPPLASFPPLRRRGDPGRPPGRPHPGDNRHEGLRPPGGLRSHRGPDRAHPGRAAPALARTLLPAVGTFGPGADRAATRHVRAGPAVGRGRGVDGPEGCDRATRLARRRLADARRQPVRPVRRGSGARRHRPAIPGSPVRRAGPVPGRACCAPERCRQARSPRCGSTHGSPSRAISPGMGRGRV